MNRNDLEQNLAVRNGTVPGEAWLQIGTVRCQDCQERYSIWRLAEGDTPARLAERCELYLQRELVREHIGLLPHADRYRLPLSVDLPEADHNQ
jgi:hypothetical protein